MKKIILIVLFLGLCVSSANAAKHNRCLGTANIAKAIMEGNIDGLNIQDARNIVLGIVPDYVEMVDCIYAMDPINPEIYKWKVYDACITDSE